jgi:hypothetical protein
MRIICVAVFLCRKVGGDINCLVVGSKNCANIAAEVGYRCFFYNIFKSFCFAFYDQWYQIRCRSKRIISFLYEIISDTAGKFTGILVSNVINSN